MKPAGAKICLRTMVPDKRTGMHNEHRIKIRPVLDVSVADW